MIETINIVPRQLEFEQHEAVKRLIYTHIRDIIKSSDIDNDKVIEDCLVIQMSDIIKEFFSKYKIDFGKLKFVTADKDSEKTIYFIYEDKYFKYITYKVEIYDWEIFGITRITNKSSNLGDMKSLNCTSREEFSIPMKSYRHKIDIVYKMYSYKLEA